MHMRICVFVYEGCVCGVCEGEGHMYVFMIRQLCFAYYSIIQSFVLKPNHIKSLSFSKVCFKAQSMYKTDILKKLLKSTMQSHVTVLGHHT